MPLLTRLLIRSALIHLALGFTFGGLMLFNKGVLIAPWLWRLLPLHVELLLFGWTVQIMMGVGFWIMPKFAGGRSRGRVWAAWAAFILLNAGVWLAGSAPLLDLPPVVALAGRLCEAGAAGLFVFHAWARIKPMSMGGHVRD